VRARDSSAEAVEIVTHCDNALDVAREFQRYRELTGDSSARLLRDGAYWRVEGRYEGLEGYGAGIMTALLRAFCRGWAR
jgi:hypothetical protein